MGLKIAEVEGDAVFFYRLGDKPNEAEVFEQVKEMYNAFHTQLKIFERDRICSCGACTTSSKLKIKFVSHYGDVVERTINDHFQLMGSDVILVHKFLKNSIDEDEYIILSEEALLSGEEDIPNWVKVNNKAENFDGVGEINYSYSSLKDLRSILPEIADKREIETIDDPIDMSIVINESMEKVYAALTDAELKLKWVNGLKDIVQEKDRVHRIGSSHDCVLPIGSIHTETVDNIKSKDSITFTEFTESSAIFPSFYQRFVLTRKDENTTDLRTEIHYKGNYFQEAILRFSMKKVLFRSLTKFKIFCENNEVEAKLLI